jgi:hypothetical protein
MARWSSSMQVQRCAAWQHRIVTRSRNDCIWNLGGKFRCVGVARALRRRRGFIGISAGYHSDAPGAGAVLCQEPRIQLLDQQCLSGVNYSFRYFYLSPVTMPRVKRYSPSRHSANRSAGVVVNTVQFLLRVAATRSEGEEESPLGDWAQDRRTICAWRDLESLCKLGQTPKDPSIIEVSERRPRQMRPMPH